MTSFASEGFAIIDEMYSDNEIGSMAGSSNWFVSYHQDLTISVNKKSDIAGYRPWTVKQDQFAVQPPQHIPEDNFTIRIHLDKTTSENGTLRVLSGSHTEEINKNK